MTFFRKYNIYKTLATDVKPIKYEDHFTYNSFKTAFTNGTQILSEKYDPDFCGEGITYNLKLTSPTGKFSNYEGVFARLVYKLLKKRYNSKNENER